MKKQNSEIRFRVSKEEHDKVKARAESVGMTIKGYILHLVLHSKVKVVVE